MDMPILFYAYKIYIQDERGYVNVIDSPTGSIKKSFLVTGKSAGELYMPTGYVHLNNKRLSDRDINYEDIAKVKAKILKDLVDGGILQIINK